MATGHSVIEAWWMVWHPIEGPAYPLEVDGASPGSSPEWGNVGESRTERPMCLLRTLVESRGTEKFCMPGSGSGMRETALPTKGKSGDRE